MFPPDYCPLCYHQTIVPMLCYHQPIIPYVITRLLSPMLLPDWCPLCYHQTIVSYVSTRLLSPMLSRLAKLLSPMLPPYYRLLCFHQTIVSYVSTRVLSPMFTTRLLSPMLSPDYCPLCYHQTVVPYVITRLLSPMLSPDCCARKRDPLSKIFRKLNLLKRVDIYYYVIGSFTHTTFNKDNPKLYKNYALFHSKHPHYSTRSTIYKCHIFDPMCDKIYYDH